MNRNSLPDVQQDTPNDEFSFQASMPQAVAIARLNFRWLWPQAGEDIVQTILLTTLQWMAGGNTAPTGERLPSSYLTAVKRALRHLAYSLGWRRIRTTIPGRSWSTHRRRAYRYVWRLYEIPVGLQFERNASRLAPRGHQQE